ncbi:iron-siderophore ABC transporter substrate-binding protein [Paenibacillus sp. UMB4589-SE434]|uniref:ABC transporter substrate-binding protein n=1 Tax=Paenibacillus sp. UMB4589-SE434 TaxID=3046314 RepID=UPI00254C8BAA|nr:iron-siderophore ABC transporter substrate-binding protein [Paenibacillus sp. UMB4589-SE434]MDK8180596.1 iron-siderophore ABC transporter substrate-binding protein [Paenibacillus sp. UMB4589-SE434]
MIRQRGSRLSVTLVICTIFALLVSGCGSKAATSEPTAPQGTSAETPAATADTEREVKHAMGTAKIKGTPERVVVLTNESTEVALELGVKPVGAVKSGAGETWFPHIKAEMDGVTELGEETEPNLELIVSLKPDLIIGNKVRHEKIYSQLDKIAPTVMSEDLAGQWKINLALYAEALNKKAEGDQAIANYDKHVAEVKDKAGSKLSTKVSVVRFTPKAVRIYQKDTFSGIILKDLGFARPASQDKDNFMEVVTKEQMSLIDGDIMFYFNADYDESKAGTKMQEEWMNDPLYKTLGVAKNNKAFKVDEVIWNLSGSIKSANLLLDEIAGYADKM